MEEAILFLDLGGHSKIIGKQWYIFFLSGGICTIIGMVTIIEPANGRRNPISWFGRPPKNHWQTVIYLRFFLVAESIQKYEEVTIIKPAHRISNPISWFGRPIKNHWQTVIELNIF
jgi:hypothetical protein